MSQWMMSQHHMKEHHTLKLMAVMAERDRAIQDCELAISEKKAAFAERDKAMMELNAALADRNKAVMERDNAVAALESARQNAYGASNSNHRYTGYPQAQGEAANTDHSQEPALSDALLIAQRSSKAPRKSKKSGHVKPSGGTGGQEWKDQDLGLNHVTFDDSTMPAPICSCTGYPRQCYKSGNGGWQSSCCTKLLSVYPLPPAPNKRGIRIGGRKMSGGAFNKLLTRLAAQGHDLSIPVDLKDHWARHGTNHYSTLK